MTGLSNRGVSMADVCAGSLTCSCVGDVSFFFLNLEVKAASDDTSSANSFTNEVKEAEACVESTCVRLQRPLTQALRRYSVDRREQPRWI